MNGSTLFIGYSKKQIDEFILEDLGNQKAFFMRVEVPDGKKNIGIDQIREIINFLGTKPKKGIIKKVYIINGELMTIQAQNALLKTLEEPPNFARIHIFTKREADIAETIISRCRRILNKETYELSNDSNNEYMNFLNLSLSQKLDWAEQTAKLDSEDIIQVFDAMIQGVHMYIKQGNIASATRNSKTIMAFRDDIEKLNVNKRLALETFVFEII